jgi:chorismate lyase/3-hydroxybenzoate synthase
MNAYEYPRIYGPRSPSFARAILRASSSGSELFVAGTASVVGHSTQHTGEPRQQTLETLHNLRALITHTEQLQGITFGQTYQQHLLKVYIRHPEHLSIVSDVLKQQVPAYTQVLYLQGEMCRSDLLLEIEGMLASR